VLLDGNKNCADWNQFKGSLYTPKANAHTGDAEDSFILTITGGKFGDEKSLALGFADRASGNTLIINSDTAISFTKGDSRHVISGGITLDESGKVSNNKVYVGYTDATMDTESANTVTLNDTGGAIGSLSSTNNHIYVSSKVTTKSIHGGFARASTSNSVTLNGGTTGIIYGGKGIMIATSNTVTMNGGTAGSIIGGEGDGESSNENTVIMDGGTVGGITGGKSELAQSNTVTINNGEVGEIVGGFDNIRGTRGTGNTLKLAQHVALAQSSEVFGFQKYAFFINEVTGASTKTPFLKATKITLEGPTEFDFVDVKGLSKDEEITLILLQATDASKSDFTKYFKDIRVKSDEASHFELVDGLKLSDDKKTISVTLRSKGMVAGSQSSFGCTVGASPSYDLALLLLAFGGLALVRIGRTRSM